MRPIVAAKTDVGRVRQGNEDSYLVAEPLFAVADGMGGHLGGEIASETAVDTITERARAEAPQDAAGLGALVRAANSAIWEKAQGDPNLHGMGTTCTLALVRDGELHLAHVGDSRAYLLRAGELSQLTDDHTLVSRMVREGRLSAEEADRHPQRSIITRALGVDADVEVDEMSLGIEEGDRFLLCSDGLTSMIDFQEVHNVLGREHDPQSAVDRLVELANEAGGEDNVTVVVIDIADDAGRSAPATAATSATPPPPPREDTDPNPVPAAPAVDTGVHRLDAVRAQEQPPRRRRSRPFLVTLLLLLILAAAAFMAARAALATSYFVGTDDNGIVTIYRGIPEEIAGLSLKQSEESTGVAVEDLPDFLRGGVEEGIKADSLEDARAKVQNLEERARDAEFEKTSQGGNNN
ncbi:MAG: Stp1/IreP family PP2C-type Ser/Thr phosphatase [Actinomycetota bacterium]|nr:Stp1/IreP family PP2C-type Ser/Thr phosphatase [Actinomycetota bacterium]